MWCSVTNTSLNNSKEATHDTTVVWAKSVSEVPGKEMERWGLTVDAWGGFSWQGKTDLVFYEDTLDAPAYQGILENSLLPAAKEWFGDEKDGWELQQDKATCHTAKSTKTWWWKSGPPKAMTLTRSRTFGPSSTRNLRAKSSRQRME
jgi:hypothetical protein